MVLHHLNDVHTFASHLNAVITLLPTPSLPSVTPFTLLGPSCHVPLLLSVYSQHSLHPLYFIPLHAAEPTHTILDEQLTLWFQFGLY